MLRANVDRNLPTRPVLHGWRLAIGGVLCAGLTAGLVSPAWASDGDDGAPAIELGSFSLGDGLEGTIGDLDGAFTFALPVGGLQLSWDSRVAGSDLQGLGDGWTFGIPSVQLTGGVRVFPASGGSYAADRSAPTGLAGYPSADIRFEVAEGDAVVPARPDGVVDARPYAYALHELGGASTYFDDLGRPIANLVLDGDRLDWLWAPGDERRLEGVVSAEGAVTALDWSDSSTLAIEAGSNVTDPAADAGAGGRWLIDLDDRQVTAVTDPVGARTAIAYDPDRRVERVSAPSDASTVVAWQASADGVARVELVRVVDDATQAELSRREWSMQGQVAPTGWPLVSEVEAGRAGAAGLGYGTTISDGSTRIGSVVDERGLLTARSVSVSTASGERMLQEQTFDYPDGPPPGGDAASRPKPDAVTTTKLDETGADRATTEAYEFDELGRMVQRTKADGTIVRRVYDEVVHAERGLPIGMVVEETTTAPDGLVVSTTHDLDDARTTVVATERWSGREGDTLTRVGLVELDQDAGFVTERRDFPGGDEQAAPVVTRWSKTLDLARGTRTLHETNAAGTAIETSTTAVSSLVHGGALTELDAVGNATATGYDAAGRPVAIEDAAGRTTHREYRTMQADGVNAVVTTGVDGVTATEVSDTLGRLVERRDDIAPDGEAGTGHVRVVERREYDGPGVERVTDAWGATTTTERDVFGRPVEVTLPNGTVQLVVHDDVAGVATSGVSTTGRIEDAELTSTVHTDELGRATATTGARADGVAVPGTAVEYDGLGREVRSTSAGVTTTTGYDAFGDAIATGVSGSALDAAGAAIPGTEATVDAERRFDATGTSVEKTMTSGDEVREGERRELDELGRVRWQADQRGTTDQLTWTPDGLVEQIVSDTGRVTTNEYDPKTRNLVGTTVTSPDGSTVSTAYERDASGRVIAVFDPNDPAGSTITSEHDDFGNVTRTAYPDGREVRHEYDAHGRELATIDAAGQRTEYEYDERDGALIAVTQQDESGAPVAGVRYTHDAFGRVETIARDNGVTTAYTFTSAGDVESETTTGPEGVQAERSYAYADTGNLLTRVDRVRNDDGTFDTTRTRYVYDALDRLLRSTVHEAGAADEAGAALVGEDGAVLTSTDYAVTVAGDIATETTVTDPGTDTEATTERSFEYSEIGELTAIVTDGVRREQRFDATGALIESADGDRFEYDALGRVTGEISAEGTTIDTSYWADGTRRDLVTGAGSTRYYWAGATLLTEVHASTDGTGGAGGTASYLLGTARHARVVQPEGGAASAAYYGTDRHGNVTDLTDELGAVTTEYAYSDYGVATVTGEAADAGATGVGELTYNPYQYASEYTSRDGTQFLGERMYEPSTARFREKDRESLANKFAFANLNPIMNVDPSGRSAESDRLSVGLTLGGFVLSLVGAGLLIASGGTALAGIGAVAGVFAAADVTLAGVEVASMLSDVKFMDEKATEIASWTLFAAGAVFAIGGAIAKYAKRGAKVLDASEQISTQTPSTPVTRRQVIVQDVPEQPGKAVVDDIIEDEGVRTWSDADQALMDEYVSMQEQLADIDDWLRLNQRAVSDLRGAAFDATNVNLRQDHLRRTNALGKVDMAVTALGEAWTAGAKALLTPLSNTAPLAKSLALLRGQRNLVLGYLGVARAQLGQATELLAPTISNATVATAHTRVTAVGASLAKLLPAF